MTDVGAATDWFPDLRVFVSQEAAQEIAVTCEHLKLSTGTPWARGQRKGGALTIREQLRKALEKVTGAAKDEITAREEKSESDIAPDSHVAGSRAGGRDGEDGPYVGRTAPQFDAETQQSGAEARSEETRQSP